MFWPLFLPCGEVGSLSNKRSQHNAKQTLLYRVPLTNSMSKGQRCLAATFLSVRLGGIYALRRLAEEHPGQYHIQSMELLCAFVRNPKEDNGVHIQKGLREDVQAVIAVIGRRETLE